MKATDFLHIIENEKGAESSCSLHTFSFQTSEIHLWTGYRSDSVMSPSLDGPRTSKQSPLTLSAAFVATSSDVSDRSSGGNKEQRHRLHLLLPSLLYFTSQCCHIAAHRPRHYKPTQKYHCWWVATLQSGNIEHRKNVCEGSYQKWHEGLF